MNDYVYNNLNIGMNASFIKKITEKDMLNFSEITGDENPLHIDGNYAKSFGFGGPVVFGMLTASLLSTLAGVYLPGRHSLILSIECFFKKPGFVGDILKVNGRIEEKIDSQNVIIIKTSIENQSKEILLTGKLFVKVLK